MHNCAACNSHKPKESFDRNVFENAKKHARLLVCASCKDDGYSPKDCEGYYCGLCKEQKGHKKFSSVSLDNFKRKLSNKLICDDCLAKRQQTEHLLRKALKKEGAWKCTCTGAKNAKTFISISNAHNPYNIDCNLRPTTHKGQQRWPGGPDSVTGFQLDAWLFLKAFADYEKR